LPPATPPPDGPPEPGGSPAAVPQGRIEIRLPSRADFLGAVRSVLRGFLEECLEVRVPPEDVAAIQMALQEACINVVRHAHARDPSLPLVVAISTDRDRLVIEVEDFGPGLPEPRLRPPDPDPAHPREGGYGLFIMRETMDEVRSEQRDGKHVLVMVRDLRRPPAPGGGA
jgi:anti-sigma regulatory factor (Ser/Thr protein kinase)